MAESILREANALNFADKFISISGRTAAGAKLLGTVANKVLHMATMPVPLARWRSCGEAK